MPRVTQNTRKKFENGSFFAKILPKGNKSLSQVKGQNAPFTKFDAGRRQSGGFRLRRDASHSRVPAFHKRHGTLRNKLFRIFRTLSDGKPELQQQEISNLDSRIIRMGASKK